MQSKKQMNIFSKIALITFFLLGFNQNFAQINQSQNIEVSPKIEITDLALHFYTINFTEEQRSLLEEKPLELIFKVEKDGKPILQKINGIGDSEIIEIFERRSQELENFNPKTVNGNPESAIYFLNISFPKKEMVSEVTHVYFESINFSKLKITDFSSITYDNTGSDILIGFVANQFIGKPSQFNGIGPGIKLDYSINDKKGFMYGINMSVYANKNKKDYNIQTNTSQQNSRSIATIGLTFGKWFNHFNIQADFNYAIQNITDKKQEKDPNWVQFKGFSPGIAANYPLLIGKEKPVLYYGSPAVIGHYINFHGGLRYVNLGHREANGIMFELGISYRLRLRNVQNYTL